MRVLHEGHPGASRMKALARVVVWWPSVTAYYILPNILSGGIKCASIFYPVG